MSREMRTLLVGLAAGAWLGGIIGAAIIHEQVRNGFIGQLNTADAMNAARVQGAAIGARYAALRCTRP